MKICRKCHKLLPFSEYYVHQKMADGHLNICKSCTKSRVSNYRQENIEKVRQYDADRNKLPHRKQQRLIQTQKSRKKVKGYMKSHNAVIRAVNKGILIRLNKCEICNKFCKTEGHHYDYSKSLEVVWLCRNCHSLYHTGKSKKADTVRRLVDSLITPEELNYGSKI